MGGEETVMYQFKEVEKKFNNKGRGEAVVHVVVKEKQKETKW